MVVSNIIISSDSSSSDSSSSDSSSNMVVGNCTISSSNNNNINWCHRRKIEDSQILGLRNIRIRKTIIGVNEIDSRSAKKWTK